MVRAGSSRSLAKTSGNGRRKVRKGAVTRRDNESRSVGRSAGSCAPCRMARLEGHHRYATAARERGPGRGGLDRVAVDGHRYSSPARPDPTAAPCSGMTKAPKSRSQTAGAATATVRLTHRAAPASGAGGPAGSQSSWGNGPAIWSRRVMLHALASVAACCTWPALRYCPPGLTAMPSNM